MQKPFPILFLLLFSFISVFAQEKQGIIGEDGALLLPVEYALVKQHLHTNFYKVAISSSRQPTKMGVFQSKNGFILPPTFLDWRPCADTLLLLQDSIGWQIYDDVKMTIYKPKTISQI